jgi:NAD(P)-dependent dehydrogenase (short-subunit alcohol dehydrogenase family)
VLTTLPLGVMAAADIARMIDINLKAPILVSKAVFRKMAGRRRGQIVNILSMAPRLCVVGDSVYAATKAGLESFSRVLNREGHPFGVHVNNIGLSAYPSGMLDKVIGTKADKVLDLIPHRAFAPLDEVIAAIEFFEAHGQDIGGQTLYFGGVA